MYIELKRKYLFCFMVMHLFIVLMNNTFKSSKGKREKEYLARYMGDAFP
jgi:hypothetical protein